MCENEAVRNAGILLHKTAILPSEQPKWLRFVWTHRKDFQPQGRFVVCSDHFEEHCFEQSFMPGAVPTIWETFPEKDFDEHFNKKINDTKTT